MEFCFSACYFGGGSMLAILFLVKICLVSMGLMAFDISSIQKNKQVYNLVAFIGNQIKKDELCLNDAASYIAGRHQVYGMGKTAEEVYRKHRNLSRPLREILEHRMKHSKKNKKSLEDAGYMLKVAAKIDALIKKNPKISTRELMIKAHLLNYDRDPNLNDILQNLSIEMILKRDQKIKKQRSPTSLRLNT